MPNDATDVGCAMADVGCESVAALLRRADRGYDVRGDLVALAYQVGQLGMREEAGFDEAFEPVRGFVGFLFDDAELVDEVGPRPRAETRDSSPRRTWPSAAVAADHVRRARGGQRLGELDHAQGERLRPGLHRVLVHGVQMVATSQVWVHPTSAIAHPTSDGSRGEVGPWRATVTATIGA